MNTTNKSKGLACAFWFFLGGLGAHNFYLDRPIVGMLQAVTSIMAVILTPLGVPLPIAIIGVWLIIDLFMILDHFEKSEAAEKKAGKLA